MIVYLSASSSERDRARWALDCIKDAPDLVLAHDWLSEIEDKYGGIANHGITLEAAGPIAWTSIAHVARSGLLWLLVPEKPTMGAGVELGAFAMAMSAGVAVRIPTSTTRTMTSRASISSPRSSAIRWVPAVRVRPAHAGAFLRRRPHAGERDL